MRTTRVVRTACWTLGASAAVLLSVAIDIRAQGTAQMPRDRPPKPSPPAAAASPDEEATLTRALAADPSNIEALRRLAAFHNRAGNFERAIQALERVAALRPADPEAHHVVGVAYFEKTRDPALAAATKQTYIDRGLAAENEALTITPEYVEALVYKNLLLRLQSVSEPDAARKQALIAEADGLRHKALQLAAAGAASVPAGTVVPTGAAPPPPPPPPPPGAPQAREMKWTYARTTYVASGGAAPVRTKEVEPIYPPIALSHGIEGTVVLEASVDASGRVSEVTVLRSQPLLTQSTIDAVRRWEFDPASIPGTAPRVITVTAVFAR